ncbi:phosphate ABC transporter substrate-binding protein PstS [Nocardioides bruguierae]|uniref:Phosphate-binding protein n=1 Tax=Nocardioides bruguierae TaxID=2945102 RepID=A0A9X2IFQ5_9ACTN|nr:phosphate ABC transporter substrate-binding protein PstS [Nocardioides bruguierae]MCL8026217.1 phosphate ABC transporter substrate-binding protein PstS [Nocardioides bruguierae]MCM0621562.1 phosphate ABC transporter substrate-binding protein PstS [Nocardioides bruguierae]
MKTTLRRAIVPGVAALALALTACGASNEETGGASADADTSLSGDLSGGGASTQQAAMGAWAVGFNATYPDVTVNYDPVGSGGGRESFIAGAYPFAGSDAYLTDDEGELSAANEQCGGTAIEVPSYVSPIAIVFNVPGVDELNLSPDTLAGIMAGQITQWDDEAIAADNPDADLPSERINAVHRSDESGTTENFTDYLTAVSPDVWDAGAIEVWPTEYGGEGAQGTSGVIQTVSGADYSIGYADASQAGDLGTANIGVGDEFVAPSAEAAAKILEVSPEADVATDTQLVFDLDHETQESGTYPIVLTSYLLGCTSYDDANTADMVKAFMSYVVSDEGQEQAASEAGSAPLSDSLQESAQAIIDQIGS